MNAEIRDLYDLALKEHSQAESSGRAAVLHALAAGEALLKIKGKIPHGEWGPWLGINCAPRRPREKSKHSRRPGAGVDAATRDRRFTHDQVIRYMRLGAYPEEVRAGNATSIEAAQKGIAGLPPRPRGDEVDERVKVRAIGLVQQGMSKTAVAREIGVERRTIARWVDPEAARSDRESALKAGARRDAALRESRRQDEARAVRKAGGAIEAGAELVNGLIDALDDAHAETWGDAREDVLAALKLARLCRDKIVGAAFKSDLGAVAA